MSDIHNIDSHKLAQHPHRVAQWLDGRADWEKAKKVYPIYVEIAPIGACNHRCTFCSVDYIGYQTRRLPFKLLITRLTEMAELNIKSVMFAGEGEPTLYPKLPEVLDHCKAISIDTALTTNMVPINPSKIDAYLRNCTWIKASINAGTAKSYAEIHQTQAKDFHRVIENLRRSIKVREENNYACTIGGQILLIPDNADEVTQLAKILRDIGVDYLVVKPYTQSLYGESRQYNGLQYNEYHQLADDLAAIETNSFRIVYRRETMDKLNEKRRPYSLCRATPFFWAYIMANGDLYSCSAYLQDDRFKIGNIIDHSFRALWESDKRQAMFHYVAQELDISQCRVNCRMDSINRYLETFDRPDPHVNFI